MQVHDHLMPPVACPARVFLHSPQKDLTPSIEAIFQAGDAFRSPGEPLTAGQHFGITAN